MSQVVIFPEGDEVRVLYPRAGRYSIHEIARQHVPPGVPFRIVAIADLPPEANYRSALAANFSSPDGVGVGPEAWRAEQLAFPRILEDA